MTRTPTFLPGIDEVKGTRDWSLLERKLLDGCKLGRRAILRGRKDLPADCEDQDRRVRAGLIRYLMLGGCDDQEGQRPHPKGVRITGGWIDGVLDMKGCSSDLDLSLQACLIPRRPVLQDARLRALYLPGCSLPEGANFHRIRTAGNIHLRARFKAGEGVDLGGAKVGGQLSCDGGRFLAGDGKALNCQAARVGTDVFLRNGFKAAAKVDFTRASVAGTLRVDNCDLRDGFDGETMRVRHGLFWRKVTGLRARVNLTEAHVGSLRDDWDSWDGVGWLALDGFRYDRLDVSMKVRDRLQWLKKNRRNPIPLSPGALEVPGGLDFDPQPHVQLSSVLRRQGDRLGAAQVLVDREIRQRRAARQRASAGLNGTWRAGLVSTQETVKRPINGLFRHMFGYGHQPMRALVWVLGIVTFAALLYGAIYDAGQMAPNSDVILTSTSWLSAIDAHEAGGAMPLQIWTAMPETQDYETFNRWIYGLDLFVPLDALGQENSWAPSPARGGLGTLGFVLRPVIQAAGWIMTALGAAVLAGLVGRRD